jgi:hypothetical protein
MAGRWSLAAWCRATTGSLPGRIFPIRFSNSQQKESRHSGARAKASEPGIHNHDRVYGFRACASRNDVHEFHDGRHQIHLRTLATRCARVVRVFFRPTKGARNAGCPLRLGRSLIGASAVRPSSLPRKCARVLDQPPILRAGSELSAYGGKTEVTGASLNLHDDPFRKLAANRLLPVQPVAINSRSVATICSGR